MKEVKSPKKPLIYYYCIVLLIIICAGSLAFIVLYNLTNINITERIREIATIKVLGFYPSETASYVFRENIFLTAIGGGAGLLLGKWLHWFVMEQINIDMVSFAMLLFASRDVYFYTKFIVEGIQTLLIIVSAFMVIYSASGRGLHDKMAETRVVMVD